MRQAILQVVPSLGIGGVEQACLDMVPAIKDAGFLPLVVSGGGARVSEVAALGGEHVALSVGNKNPLSAYGMMRRLCGVMESYNVCLLHAHSRMPAWLGYYAARRLEVPFITSFHGAYGISHGLKRRYNSVMARGERVMAVSQFIRSHILSHYGDYVSEDRISVVYNGIDVSRFDIGLVSDDSLTRLRRSLDLPEGLRWLVMVGRPTRLKGHGLVAEAYRRLRSRYDNLGLLFIVPEGGEGSEVEGGEGIYVRSVGDDLLPLVYGLGEVCLVGSLVPEAFGRVVIEAQLMGGIVVAPSCGGCLELVSDGEDGFLYGMGDADDLVRVLGYVLDLSESERKRVRLAGVGSGKGYGLDIFRKRILKNYFFLSLSSSLL